MTPKRAAALTGADLRGVTVAAVLPFDEAGAIDWDGYARVLDHCAVVDDVRAVFVNGHAGEGAALTRDERIEVLRRTREQIGPAKPLLAGVIAFSTAEAIAEAQIAAENGADVAVLFPPPSLAAGGTASPQGPLAFVEAVIRAVPIPVSIFQYPITSGLGYTTETLVAMAQLSSCIAIKEGSDDIAAYARNRRALHRAAPGVALLPSNFDWFLPQLAIGGDGILSGLASLVPRHLRRLWDASERQDLAAMRAASDRLDPIVRAIYAPPRLDMHTRIKAGLKRLGVIACAHPRGPLLPIGPEQESAIAAALTAAGITAATA